MTRAVTFDFWNTLMWEVPGELRDQRLRYWARTLPEVDPDALAAAHDAAHERYLACWSAGEQFLVQDAARLMRSLLGDGVAETVLLEGFDEGGRSAAIAPCEGVRECLAALKDAGVGLGIVCDIGLTPSLVVRELLERNGLLGYFDDAAFSDEVGHYKPSPAIFEHALRELGGVAAVDAAHVGDRQRTDIGGAQAIGMTAIRYSAILDEDDPDLPQADFVTADLAQIPALLGVGAPSGRNGATAAAELMGQEAEAILAMAANLDMQRFEQAVELLAGCAGNVATVGAGVSGIVARKIAATLTSTGTPAIFVHPADALHGGLGVIGDREVIVAVSNSGETEEVLALLPYLRTRDVPVIAIVGNMRSKLAAQAAVAVEAHAAREAGHLALAPTSSVAVALAVADALALTVMERKGITPEGFAVNHPSGRLGRRLTLRVRDVMHPVGGVPVVCAHTLLLDVVAAITDGGLGAVPIVSDGGRLGGLITDGDVRRALQKCDISRLGAVMASDVMTADPVVVAPEAMAYHALRLMEDRPSQIAVLPVVQDGRCTGLLRLHDLARIGL